MVFATPRKTQVHLGGVNMTPGQLTLYAPVQVNSGSLLSICICLHDTIPFEFTPVVVTEQEFHSGTKFRNNIM